MKSRFAVLIAVILGLVVLFCIIGRRCFDHKDSALDSRTERTVSSAETESDTVPESESEAGIKAAGEMKPETAATEGKPAPSAVPVATREEAEKYNQLAIDHAESMKRKKDKSLLEGKVISMSECPDPLEIDYPNCNLAMTISINDIDHTKIVLIVPCIRDSRIVFPSGIQVDSLVAFRLVDESGLSEDEKSIQLSDDNPDYALDYCWAHEVNAISSFSKISTYTSNQTNKLVYDTRLPLTDEDVITRKEYMNEELARLDKIIDDYSAAEAKKAFDGFIELTKGTGENHHPCAEVYIDDGSRRLIPLDCTFSPAKHLDAAFSRNTDLMYHNAQIIASVNRFLKEMGIILIVVPFPQHFESVFDYLKLSKPLSTYNINRTTFMKYLLEMDCEVLDIEPMIEQKTPSRALLYRSFRKDFHPSETGAFCCAQAIYDHLNKYIFLGKLQKNNYSIQIEKYTSDIPYYDTELKDVEDIKIAELIDPHDKQSPFLLVGDSFSMGTFPNYLANALNTKINVINATGSYPLTARLLQQRKNEISSNTKVCILVDTSYSLKDSFLPFVDDGITLYPNQSFFPDTTLSAEGKDLQESLSLNFDLDISSIAQDSNKYKLVFFVSSTDRQNYELKVNAMPSVTATTARTGHAVIDYPLTETDHLLHIVLSTTPDDNNYPLRNKQNLTLVVEKILLVEE